MPKPGASGVKMLKKDALLTPSSGLRALQHQSQPALAKSFGFTRCCFFPAPKLRFLEKCPAGGLCVCVREGVSGLGSSVTSGVSV